MPLTDGQKSGTIYPSNQVRHDVRLKKGACVIMADEKFEEEILTLTDEDGNESDFEFAGKLELDGNTYVALVPVEGNDEEFVILKLATDENGEEYLATVDDDDEFDKAADAFEDEFFSEIDYDENEGEANK